jgi:hypothetical protein
MVRAPTMLAISVAALVIAQGCGTDATGVDACQAVMAARCQQAPNCKIKLDPPYATSGSDVEACIRFYDIACLHGVSTSDPGPTKVQECVAAIQGHCSVVSKPETDPACGWLVPPPASNDASDAPSEASEAGDAAPGATGQ